MYVHCTRSHAYRMYMSKNRALEIISMSLQAKVIFLPTSPWYMRFFVRICLYMSDIKWFPSMIPINCNFMHYPTIITNWEIQLFFRCVEHNHFLIPRVNGIDTLCETKNRNILYSSHTVQRSHIRTISTLTWNSMETRIKYCTQQILCTHNNWSLFCW